MHPVGDGAAGVLVDHAGVGEIHQHRPTPGAGVAHRLACLAQGALEIGGDRHLQLAQAQLQTHIGALLAGCGVDRTHQGAIGGIAHRLHHLGTHPAQGASHHHRYWGGGGLGSLGGEGARHGRGAQPVGRVLAAGGGSHRCCCRAYGAALLLPTPALGCSRESVLAMDVGGTFRWCGRGWLGVGLP